MAEYSDGIIVYAGTYDSVDAAKEDFEVIKAAHAEKWIGTYDAALFDKTEDGKVKILDTDATQRGYGATVGGLAGAIFGLIFPPGLLFGAAIGAGVGAIIGNLAKGFSRKDIHEVGESLDDGQCGIILVADATTEAGLERLMKRAKKVAKKEVNASAAELKKAIDEA